MSLKSCQISGNLFYLHVQCILEKAPSNIFTVESLDCNTMFAGNLPGVLGESYIFNPQKLYQQPPKFLEAVVIIVFIVLYYIVVVLYCNY